MVETAPSVAPAPLPALGRTAASRSLRPFAQFLIPCALFVVVAVIQGLLTIFLYHRATASVEQVIASRIADAATTVTHDIDHDLLTTPSLDLSQALARCARMYHLEQALIVDAQGYELADANGGTIGQQANFLTISLNKVHAALQTDHFSVGTPLSADVPTRMVYSPLHRNGHPWAVLCIELPDPLPGVTERLHLPFYFAAAIGIAIAALLMVLLLLAQRALDASRRHMRQIHALANAGMLAAAIAHDIKNPLGLILSSTQLLAASPRIDDHERATLRAVEDEVRRADDELNGYLDLVREMPLKLAPVDLLALATSSISLLITKAERHDVAIHLVGDRPVMVMADRRRLHQVLINLVINAIEALAEQGGMITVTIAQEGGCAQILVADDGPGIPALLAKRLFEPFATSKPQGTGLGLSMARRACERHRGSLTLVQATPAVFMVQLPLLAERNGPCAS